MLTLVTGITAYKPDYYLLYFNAYMRKARQWKALLEENPQADDKAIRRQLLFYGVRLINNSQRHDERTEEMIRLDIVLADCFLAVISSLTPRELISVFPVEKRYDGERRGEKDYFFTMNELQTIGMDTAIGDKAQELTWDYENEDIREFAIRRMRAYSAAYKMQTGRSIEEEWAEKMGISTYYMRQSATTGRKYLYDPKTGRSNPIFPKRPRYLRLVGSINDQPAILPKRQDKRMDLGGKV